MMKILGKPTLNPIIFYGGKFSGFLTWIVFALPKESINGFRIEININTKFLILVLLVLGVFFTIISLVNLGKSIRMGLPNEKTSLKTKGVYAISRNPMYLGINLITIAAIVFSLNPIVVLLGFFGIGVNHLIIKGEERFLQKAFGNDFTDYRRKVRRYL